MKVTVPAINPVRNLLSKKIRSDMIQRCIFTPKTQARRLTYIKNMDINLRSQF